MTHEGGRTTANEGDDARARARRRRLVLVLAVIAAVLVIAGVIAAITLSRDDLEQVPSTPTTGEPGTTPDVTPSSPAPGPSPTPTPDPGEPAPAPAPSPTADPTPSPSLSAPPAQDVPYPTDPNHGK
ncbi:MULTISPECIES: hypothetical protein [Clavibacter]|uniref:Uncharacterized protein n=2 Tax=Clavibacter TaxID=1573 RepID=A0A399NV22_9MICO|nr:MULTISPECIES: hypothetical protein [Clavibacter]KDP92505.1 hypothetical protein W824_00675 [Clavibacter cf. michiganensis LMG 26808]RII97139.1 hypothetical protein DZF96_08570 [Clavibacter michiganensis]UKF26673.1 hypothetical protein KYT88_10630 [Clavibacter sp. A6099]